MRRFVAEAGDCKRGVTRLNPSHGGVDVFGLIHVSAHVFDSGVALVRTIRRNVKAPDLPPPPLASSAPTLCSPTKPTPATRHCLPEMGVAFTQSDCHVALGLVIFIVSRGL